MRRALRRAPGCACRLRPIWLGHKPRGGAMCAIAPACGALRADWRWSRAVGATEPAGVRAGRVEITASACHISRVERDPVADVRYPLRGNRDVLWPPRATRAGRGAPRRRRSDRGDRAAGLRLVVGLAGQLHRLAGGRRPAVRRHLRRGDLRQHLRPGAAALERAVRGGTGPQQYIKQSGVLVFIASAPKRGGPDRSVAHTWW